MKLYGSYTSPFVRHCRIALAESSIPWTLNEADYAMSAKESPTKRVPYLKDGEVFLSDSSSILKHIREKSGRPFFPKTAEFELYCITNTLLDTSVNLFLLEKEGLTPENTPYLKRQTERIQSGLELLKKAQYPTVTPFADHVIRLGCYLEWAVFRERLAVEDLGPLSALVESLNSWDEFKKTHPSFHPANAY